VGSRAIELVETQDGSNTLYSKEYNQHYHSTKDGALNESFLKHILPAFKYHKVKKDFVILDICFGLGYNTLATLYHLQKQNIDCKVHIYSPELDLELIQGLKNFVYPQEFKAFYKIIESLSNKLFYEDENYKIQIYNQDAREVLQELNEKNIKFDIVYQDPFSSDVNRSLWTQEYFKQIVKLLAEDGIITTYSIATPVRLSMYENRLNIYEILQDNNKKSTIALKKKIDDPSFHYVDMELKKIRNQNAKALKDEE